MLIDFRNTDTKGSGVQEGQLSSFPAAQDARPDTYNMQHVEPPFKSVALVAPWQSPHLRD